LPGNRVDVLAARKNGQQNTAKVEMILQDVKVLAVDQEASQDKDKPIVVRAVTLEMTPEQTEVLVKATEEGSIQLALRNPLDESIRAKKEVSAKAAPASRPIRRRPTARVAHSNMITVIKGTASALMKCNRIKCEYAGRL
ncbi:MAG: Flp pilus assembly protein CpaB, partial [Pseudomonadota bacterium]